MFKSGALNGCYRTTHLSNLGRICLQVVLLPPKIYVMEADSLAVGQDAMLHQCEKVTYLFQPVPLMLRVLQKFSQSQYQPCSSLQYGPLLCGSPAAGTFSSATTLAASLLGCSNSVESRVLSSPEAFNSSSCGFPHEPAALDLDEKDLTFVFISLTI